MKYDRIKIQKRIARVNIRRAFGPLPLEAINKYTDREILMHKHIGVRTFIYIKTMGRSCTNLEA